MKSLKKVSSLVSLGAGVLAIVLFLVTPVVSVVGKITGETWKEFNGAQVAFGFSEGSNVSVKVLDPSFLAIAALVLVLAGAVLALLSGNGKKVNKLFVLVSLAAFVVAAVFFFLSSVGTNFVTDISSLYVVNLGVGAIIPGILSAIAGLFALIKLL